MGFQEKNVIVNIFSTIVITIVYWLYIYQRYQETNPSESEIFQFWGLAFIILIVISIVLKVIIVVLFTILNYIITREEEDPSFTDERDELIELKATRNSLYVFSIGIVIGMGLLAVGLPPNALFVMVIVSGTLSDLFGEMSKFYFYRRGF